MKRFKPGQIVSLISTAKRAEVRNEFLIADIWEFTKFKQLEEVGFSKYEFEVWHDYSFTPPDWITVKAKYTIFSQAGSAVDVSIHQVPQELVVLLCRQCRGL